LESLLESLRIAGGYAPPHPCRKLGIDLVFDNDLLYIAEDLIVSELPGAYLPKT
jgi:hypothetical protein